MRQVYDGNNDNITEAAKFNLNKNLVPQLVERAEIEISRILGSNITISIPKEQLTFFAGNQHPYTKVAASSEVEAKYIVLPWDISTLTGKERLRSLIDQLTINVTSLKYTLYLSNEGVSTSELGNFAELSISRQSLADESEQLLRQIESLEARKSELERLLEASRAETAEQKNLLEQQRQLAEQRQTALTDLNRQHASLQAQNNSLQAQLESSKRQINKLQQNQVTWNTTIPNQTSLDFTGFTGKLTATINPVNGTFNVSIV